MRRLLYRRKTKVGPIWRANRFVLSFFPAPSHHFHVIYKRNRFDFPKSDQK